MKKEPKYTELITAKIDKTLHDKLKEEALKPEQDKSKIIRQALRMRLY